MRIGEPVGPECLVADADRTSDRVKKLVGARLSNYARHQAARWVEDGVEDLVRNLAWPVIWNELYPRLRGWRIL